MRSKSVVASTGATSLTGLGLVLAQIVGATTGNTPTNTGALIVGCVTLVLGLVGMFAHLNTQKGINVGVQQTIDGFVSRIETAIKAISSGGVVQSVVADFSALEKVVKDVEELASRFTGKSQTASTGTDVPPGTTPPAGTPPAAITDFSKLSQ